MSSLALKLDDDCGCIGLKNLRQFDFLAIAAVYVFKDLKKKTAFLFLRKSLDDRARVDIKESFFLNKLEELAFRFGKMGHIFLGQFVD